MKKPRPGILIAVTCVFAAFTLGFFLGRNGNHGGVQLSVPAAMQTIPPETTVPEQTTPGAAPVVFPIDINTADAGQFTALPGIGDVLANRIIAYREENGSFTATEELMNVEGIGEKRMEAILDLITIGGSK